MPPFIVDLDSTDISDNGSISEEHDSSNNDSRLYPSDHSESNASIQSDSDAEDSFPDDDLEHRLSLTGGSTSSGDTRVEDDEASDDWEGLSNGDDAHVSTDADVEEEDGLDSFAKSRFGHNTISQLNQVHTKEAFRDRLYEVETHADLRLLYPPSLWKQQDKSAQTNENQCIRNAFMSQPSMSPGSQSDWRQIDVMDFCLYNGLNHKRFPGQYENLHIIASEQGKRTYLLDGSVDHHGQQIALQGTQIISVSIGGLDLDCHSCGEQFWVQTIDSSKFNGWLRLKQPAYTYQSFWQSFVWLANFAKYCIDYLTIAEERHRLVTLDDFRSDFLKCMIQRHGHDDGFQRWQPKNGPGQDMRRHLAQFGSFVYDQCYSAELLDHFESHPVWKDIGCFVPRKIAGTERTLVTRNTASTFLPSFPQWGPDGFNLLEEADCDTKVEAFRGKRMRALQIPNKFGLPQHENFRIQDRVRISKAEWTLREATEKNSTVPCPAAHLLKKLVVVRQHEGSKLHFDFAFVIEVSRGKKHVRVVWLSLPSNTICASPNPGTSRGSMKQRKLKAHYPIGNELFFSDDCNCFAVSITDIVGCFNITVLEDFTGQACEFFAVTQYLEKEECFVRTTQSRLEWTCRPTCTRPSAKGSQTRTIATCRRQRSLGLKVDLAPLQRNSHHRSLSNLSLFSGCGLFDRALETSGLLRTTLSIDCNQLAMCSAKANSQHCSDKSKQEFIVESVSTELRNVMTGERAHPQPGCLSAGCPCPGFSLANSNKKSKRSQRDCTLLASTMSWIEVTLPAYVVIENVIHMDAGELSACSQAISFLVALGYQVRKVRLKATEFGGCTIRRRLFLFATAPAYRLPDSPLPTHGNTDSLKPMITIREAISDLAPMHNDTLVSISEPYHIPLDRLPANITTDRANLRDMLHRIPTSPSGQGLATSHHLMTSSQKRWIRSLSTHKTQAGSQTMRRIDPDGFFHTIMTGVNWLCAQGGQLIHHAQDRLVTLEEVARAQGVPHDFVLVGSMSQKLRQVGNAVTWCLREAVGREITKAYLQSEPVDVELASAVERQKEPKTMTAKTAEVNEDEEEDDLIFSTEAAYNQAVARRKEGSSPHKFNTILHTSTTCKSSSTIQYGDAAVSSIEQHTTYENTSLPRTSELRNKRRQPLSAVRKRSRSATIPTFSEEEGDDVARRIRKRVR